jgi:hypothetical protein
MPSRTKDIEIELSDGTIVESRLKVEGFFDDQHVSDSGEMGQWVVGSWETDHSAELDENQQSEFDEEIEEIVFTEKWHFESAPKEDEDDGSEY